MAGTYRWIPRARGWYVAVAVAVVVTIAVGVVRANDTDRPPRVTVDQPHVLQAMPHGTRPLADPARIERAKTLLGRDEALVHYGPGQEWVMAFYVSNHGRRDVRVTDVAGSMDGWYLAEDVGVFAGDVSTMTERRLPDRGHISGPIEMVRFRPFSLRAGDSHLVAVTFRFRAGCAAPEGPQYNTPVPAVTYEAGGQTRRVHSRGALAFAVQGARCPAQ